MTYSEIVALLSSQMVPKDVDSQQMIPMLEKFVNQELNEGEEGVDDSQQFSSGAHLED